MYAAIVFFHVVGAVGLFCALTLEWASVRKLAQAASLEEARAWNSLQGWLLPIGLSSTLVVLASGIYLASSSGGWAWTWVQVAIPTMVVVAAAGGALTPLRKRAQAAITQGTGTLPEAAQAQLADKWSLASLRFRAALLLGLVFEMTVRPNGQVALVVLGIAAFLGGAAGLLVRGPARLAMAPARR
jgi:hypothetical protein